MKQHILVIEDDNRVANLLRRGLEQAHFEVDLAYDGLLGQRLALQKNYDLVITDIMLPKINGLDLCKKLREQGCSSPIIMLTALGQTDDKLEGFDAGADDYLVKPFDMRELLARVRVLIQRGQGQQPRNAQLQYADLSMNLDTKLVTRKGDKLSLSPKEFKLLQFLLENPERVISKIEIAEKVWDTHFDTGTNFIEVYLTYLRKKIDKPYEEKLIHTKTGMGIILTKEAP